MLLFGTYPSINTEMSSFEGVGIDTEVSSFQGVGIDTGMPLSQGIGIEGLHCIQKCPHLDLE